MLHTIKRHFKNELECYLFWLGGCMTLAWIVILLSESYGANVAERALTSEDTLLYLGSLAFVLGIKGVRRRLNHNHDDDAYVGEIWTIPLLCASFVILVDYHVIGFAVKKSDELYHSLFGVMGLFGITKAADFWDLIKSRLSVFKNRPASS